MKIIKEQKPFRDIINEVIYCNIKQSNYKKVALYIKQNNVVKDINFKVWFSLHYFHNIANQINDNF